MITKTLLTLLLSVSYLFVAAQKQDISGTIIDAETEEAVPFAQVAIYDASAQELITGTTTGPKGTFNLKVSPGQYTVNVSFVGYEDFQRSLQVQSSPVDLGKIRITVAEQLMEEVVVKGNEVKQPVLTTMEGMEIKPDATIANVGGSLLDILRNTPSVSVGDDGSVSLRGSGSTNVLIDGRNSALATDLEQIPASAIEKITIINNPNAKYDASSDGGVINIVLKQGEDLGTNARAELTAGTRMRTNASLNLSRRTDNYAVYGGYSYRKWPRVGEGSTTRETFSDNELLQQSSTDSREDTEHTINYGGDYYWGKNKISLEGVFNTEVEDDFSSNTTTLQNTQTDEMLLSYVRNNNETEDNYTIDNAVIYERSFEDDLKSFRASLSTSIRDQLEKQHIDIFNNTVNPEGRRADRMERSQTDELRNTSVAQVDFSFPLLTGKAEGGYKSILRKFDNDFQYGLYNPDTDIFTNYDSISNRFIYQDQIHALYGIYSDSLYQLNYAVGVRAEQTLVNTELVNTEQTNQQRYLNFFPSVQVGYALDKKNTLKLTYSRRIDRPNAWRLNPFPDYADSLNVRVGDPNLQPEYIHSFELGHMIDLGAFTLTSNAFYRRIDGQVDWIVEVRDGISNRGPRNLNVSHLYGAEFINTTEITKWWNMNGSFSIFETVVDGTNLDESFTNRGLSWYAKLTTELSLPADINLQFTGNYTAPEIEAQGRDLARYYVDASLQRYFMNKAITLSASFRDIFDTRNFRGENSGDDFRQTFVRKRETQILLITASYNFNRPL